MTQWPSLFPSCVTALERWVTSSSSVTLVFCSLKNTGSAPTGGELRGFIRADTPISAVDERVRWGDVPSSSFTGAQKWENCASWKLKDVLVGVFYSKLLGDSGELIILQNPGSSRVQEGNKKQPKKWVICLPRTYESAVSLFLFFFSHFTEWFNPSRRLHARSVQSVLKQPLPSAWDRPHLFWVVRKDSHCVIYLFFSFTDFSGLRMAK